MKKVSLPRQEVPEVVPSEEEEISEETLEDVRVEVSLNVRDFLPVLGVLGAVDLGEDEEDSGGVLSGEEGVLIAERVIEFVSFLLK